MMRITVLAFGVVKDIFNASSISLNVPEHITVIDLKKKLQQEYPALNKLSVYMIAVNNEYAAEKYLIAEKDEIAIIPPVSGG